MVYHGGELVTSAVLVPEEIAGHFQDSLKASGIEVELHELQEELVLHPRTRKVTAASLCPFLEGRMTPAQMRLYIDKNRSLIERRHNPRDPQEYKRLLDVFRSM